MLVALTVSSGVKDVGAYAGFAAIIGLGVLALLYFAQAREVKRLRDWAGRAPERAAELEEQAMARPRAAAPPAPVAVREPAGTPSVRRLPDRPAPAATTAAPSAPSVAPAPSAPSAARVAPAMMAAPALASATRYAPSPAPPQPEPGPEPDAEPPTRVEPAPSRAVPEPEDPPTTAAPAVTPEAGVPAALTAAAARPAPARPAPAATPPPATPQGNGAGQTDVTRPVASPAPPPPPRRIQPAPRQSAPVPPPATARRRGPALTVIGILVALVVIAGGAFAAIRLLSDNGSSAKGPTSAARAAGKTGKKRSRPGAAFSGKGITITVLNGTPVPGLAKRVGSQLVAKGFKQGAVTNASDQARSATIVSYLPGHRADAERVSRALRRAAVEPIDPTTRGIACPNATCASTVVVTVGADLAQ